MHACALKCGPFHGGATLSRARARPPCRPSAQTPTGRRCATLFRGRYRTAAYYQLGRRGPSSAPSPSARGAARAAEMTCQMLPTTCRPYLRHTTTHRHHSNVHICSSNRQPSHQEARGVSAGSPLNMGRAISPSLFRGSSPLPFLSCNQHVSRVEGRSPRRKFRLRGLHRGHQRAHDSARGRVLAYPRVVGREPLVVAHSKKGIVYQHRVRTPCLLE